VRGLAGATNGSSLSDDAHANRLFADDAPAEPDFGSALKWARQAAESGSSEAQALLGYIFTYGPEPLRDQDDADRWYERSAMAGCPQGNLGYALSLARRATDDEGHRQVVDQLRCAAAAKLPTAIYLLGVLTEHGTGVPRDPLLAAEYYRDAAEKGHRPAQVKWGLALIEGRHVDQDLVAGDRACAARRSPAIRRRQPWSAISMFTVVHCRRTMPRLQAGIAGLRRRGRDPLPGRWVHCT
jgi:TPR repeat protein